MSNISRIRSGPSPEVLRLEDRTRMLRRAFAEVRDLKRSPQLRAIEAESAFMGSPLEEGVKYVGECRILETQFIASQPFADLDGHLHPAPKRRKIKALYLPSHTLFQFTVSDTIAVYGADVDEVVKISFELRPQAWKSEKASVPVAHKIRTLSRADDLIVKAYDDAKEIATRYPLPPLSTA